MVPHTSHHITYHHIRPHQITCRPSSVLTAFPSSNTKHPVAKYTLSLLPSLCKIGCGRVNICCTPVYIYISMLRSLVRASDNIVIKRVGHVPLFRKYPLTKAMSASQSARRQPAGTEVAFDVHEESSYSYSSTAALSIVA